MTQSSACVSLSTTTRVTMYNLCSCFVGQDMVGLFLHPHSNTQQALENVVHQFTLFSVHTRAPYVRSCKTVSHARIKQHKLAAGVGVGWPNFFGGLRKDYPIDDPANYSGPFMVGVCWQDASDADSSRSYYHVSIPWSCTVCAKSFELSRQ